MPPVNLSGYSWSNITLDRVMNDQGLVDRDALLEEAVNHDADSNQYLKTSELRAAAQALLAQDPQPAPETTPPQGYRWSTSVLARIMSESGIDDTNALLNEAVRHDDGNQYLKTSELQAAADAMVAGGSQSSGDPPQGYRWSPSVLARIMSESGITDENALLNEAVRHDDGNKYLKTSELQAAADAMGSDPAGPTGPELGIVSDLDKTVIPKHSGDLPDKAYPGVATLLRELEFRDRGAAGDIYYVTARSEDRVEKIPRWLDRRAVPAGPIATGISPLPWVAQPEKVRDISAILDAHPDQTFVLFGDSSHRDPEVFTEIMAAYPDQIAAAFVHKVNNTVNPNRVVDMNLIENYAEAAAILFGAGELSEAGARRVMEAAQREGLEITGAEIDALIADHRP